MHCTPCQEFAISPAGSTNLLDCQCDFSRGYSQIENSDPPECVRWGPGTYVDEIIGCINCAIGKYTDGYGMTACKDCPDYSTTLRNGSAACLCEAGYTVENTTQQQPPAVQCVPCESDFFKDEISNDACTTCQANSQTLLPGTDHQKKCLCDLGYHFFSAEFPDACAGVQPLCVWSLDDPSNIHPGGVKGKYALLPIEVFPDWDGVDGLQHQSFYHYSTDPAHCNSEFGRGESTAFEIIHPVPHWADEWDCDPDLVAQGHFVLRYDSGGCKNRDDNFNPDDRLYRYDPAGIFCDPSNYGEYVCRECLAGKFSTVLNSQNCTSCEPLHFTKETSRPFNRSNVCLQCTPCGPNFYDDANDGEGCGGSIPSQCQECIPNAITDPSKPDDYHFIGAQSCACRPHYTGTRGSQCNSCNISNGVIMNRVRPGWVDADTHSGHCECAAGFYQAGDSVFEPCVKCPEGTFKVNAGNDLSLCVACPSQFAFSPAGSTSESACLCGKGRYFNSVDFDCKLCPLNQYQDEFGRFPHCKNRRPNSITDHQGTQNGEDCLCQPGLFFANRDNAGYDIDPASLQPLASNLNDVEKWDLDDSGLTISAIYHVHENQNCFGAGVQVDGDWLVTDADLNICKEWCTSLNCDCFVVTNNRCYYKKGSTLSNFAGFTSYRKEIIRIEETKINDVFNSYLFRSNLTGLSENNVHQSSSRLAIDLLYWIDFPVLTGEQKILEENDEYAFYHNADADVHIYKRRVTNTGTLRRCLSDFRHVPCVLTNVSQAHNILVTKSWVQKCPYDPFASLSLCTYSYEYVNILLGTLSTAQENSHFEWHPHRIDIWSPNVPFFPVTDFSAQRCSSFETTLNCIYPRIWPVLPNNTCVQCLPGTFKVEVGNEFCSFCPSDTFSQHGDVHSCAACPPFTGTRGRTGQTFCDCDNGFTLSDPTDVYSTCVACQSGKFRSDQDDVHCSDCGSCGANEQVSEICRADADIQCIPCQANSYSPAGATEPALCICNAGYFLNGSECDKCPIGFYRNDISQNGPCQPCADGLFADALGSEICLPCDTHCVDPNPSNHYRRYITKTCSQFNNIICDNCTLCPAGTFASVFCSDIPTDRNDTVCTICTPGFYCPGMPSQARISCPEASVSLAGASSLSDCPCAGGYYQTLSGCSACEHDTYCPAFNGDKNECPPHSFTYSNRRTNIESCICEQGFYKQPLQNASLFTCEVCTPNDYCFNNSRLNCSDPRMLSDVGSKSSEDCICMEGFYNEGETCLPCAVDHYCVNGIQEECPEHFWTNNLTTQSSCVCQPGFLLQNNTCVTCEADFCPGHDNSSVACTEHSQSPIGSSQELDCLCKSGFQAISQLGSHACQACEQGSTFKNSIGNTACLTCKQCSANIDREFELHACTPHADAICMPCNTCEGQFIGTECRDKVDTICNNCSTCDYSEEYRAQDCMNVLGGDTVCQPINRNLSTCGVGEYLGQHNETHNSYCATCKYHDLKLLGHTLHTARTNGQEYDNAFSCGAFCLGKSKLRDVNREWFGCVTCESSTTLNSLITVEYDLYQRATACHTTCRTGYEFSGNTQSCIPKALESSSRFHIQHTVRVTDFWEEATYTARDASSYDNNGYRFTVQHSTHNFYVLLVGPTEPTCTRSRPKECCFATNWRISNSTLLGLFSGNIESCSRQPMLNFNLMSSTEHSFSIPANMISEVATCVEADKNKYSCSFYVTILDTVLWSQLSVPVTLNISRTAKSSLMATGTYIPLTTFLADVSLLKITASGAHVYELKTIINASQPLTIDVKVKGASLAQTSHNWLVDCQRTSHVPTMLSNFTEPQILVRANQEIVFTLHWVSAGSTSNFHAFYTLRDAFHSVHNMDIAVIRDVSSLLPTCDERNLLATPPAITTGKIFSAWGFGSKALTNWQRHYHIQHSSGDLDNLLTLYLEADFASISRIKLSSLLIAYIAKNVQVPASIMDHAVDNRGQDLLFSANFTSWCRHTTKFCKYEYVARYPHPMLMFELESCSDSSKYAARKFLQNSFNIHTTEHHNYEHIETICERMARSETRGLKPRLC